MLHQKLMLAPDVLISTVRKRDLTPIHQIWTFLSERQEMATMWSGFGNIRTAGCNRAKPDANDTTLKNIQIKLIRGSYEKVGEGFGVILGDNRDYCPCSGPRLFYHELNRIALPRERRRISGKKMRRETPSLPRGNKRKLRSMRSWCV
jgi:hypothetical protein